LEPPIKNKTFNEKYIMGMTLKFNKKNALEWSPPKDLTMYRLRYVGTEVLPRNTIDSNAEDQFRSNDRDPTQAGDLRSNYKKDGFDHTKPRQWIVDILDTNKLISGWQRDEAQESLDVLDAPYDKYEPIGELDDEFYDLLEQAKIVGNDTPDHYSAARKNTLSDMIKHILKALQNGRIENTKKGIVERLEKVYPRYPETHNTIYAHVRDSVPKHPTLVVYSNDRANRKAKELIIPHEGSAGLSGYLGWILKNKPSKDAIWEGLFSNDEHLLETRYFTFYIRRPSPSKAILKSQREKKYEEFKKLIDLLYKVIATYMNMTIIEVEEKFKHKMIFNHFLPNHDYEEKFNSLIDVNGNPIKSEHLK